MTTPLRTAITKMLVGDPLSAAEAVPLIAQIALLQATVAESAQLIAEQGTYIKHLEKEARS